MANFKSIGIYFNFIPIHLQVEKGSKAAKAGLKRGDQVLEVNSRDFEKGMPLQKAQTILMETTHIQFTVRSNLLGKYCLATILPNAINHIFTGLSNSDNVCQNKLKILPSCVRK